VNRTRSARSRGVTRPEVWQRRARRSMTGTRRRGNKAVTCARHAPAPMSFDAFLVWLESTALSEWVTGSPSMLAFPGILALHAIGMGVAAGLAAVLDLRILGVARGVPLVEFG